MLSAGWLCNPLVLLTIRCGPCRYAFGLSCAGLRARGVGGPS
jgi:hypothetical protein